MTAISMAIPTSAIGAPAKRTPTEMPMTTCARAMITGGTAACVRPEKCSAAETRAGPNSSGLGRRRCLPSRMPTMPAASSHAISVEEGIHNHCDKAGAVLLMSTWPINCKTGGMATSRTNMRTAWVMPMIRKSAPEESAIPVTVETPPGTPA